MYHEKFGKIGFLLCGGGCAGLPQAVQLREFEKAGISPDWVGAVSVGAFNAIDRKNVIEVWKKYIISPFAIYDLHPTLKKIFKETRQFIAPFKRHDSWKEWGHDFKFQKQNAIHFILFCKRTIFTALKIARDFPNNDFANPKDFASISELAIEALKEHDLYNLSSILDISPLMKIVKENMDLEAALSGTPLNIFVRHLHSGREHILTPKSVPELLSALQATSALVPFFEPIKIGEEYFCDIGAVNPFPAEYAFDEKCDTVFAFTKGYKKQLPKPRNVIEMWFLEIEVHTRKMFMLLYHKAKERAEKEGRKLYLVPQFPLHTDLDFLSISPEAIEYTIENESKATQKFLEKIL